MIVMGRVTAPFGVQGWVKVQPLTQARGSLCGYRRWWLGGNGDWREVEVATARISGSALIARLEGVDDRETAASLRGSEIAVPRDAMPIAGSGEYYWADLIGLRVVNVEGHEFGRVARMLATGANDVLVTDGARETLIPFIAGVIRSVDLAAGEIVVEWGADY
jgi:16S rRNA processing protein RimM